MIDLDFTAKFIAGFEGFVGSVYLDTVGVETIGYGETRRDIIERYRQSGISKQDAMELLKQRVQEFADAVEGRITNSAALTPNRHAALTSLAYNIGAGVGGFADSTACKRFNSGDLAGVPEAMGWWNKGDGKVIEGLTRRRTAEGALFMQDGPAALPGGQGSGGGGGGGGEVVVVSSCCAWAIGGTTSAPPRPAWPCAGRCSRSTPTTARRRWTWWSPSSASAAWTPTASSARPPGRACRQPPPPLLRTPPGALPGPVAS